MNFGDNSDLQDFRSRLRSWLGEHVIERRPDEPEARFLQRWHQTLFDGGWMGLSWPVDYGGQELSPTYEAVVNDELGAFGAPDAPRIGYLGRAILEFGTDGQRRRYLGPLLAGVESWCQGFSEPGAGSDLASLLTRAVGTPDGYRISGQKVWTSYADYSDLCLLLARTADPEERHRGISAFIVPMDRPGIDIRPLRASTGEVEFCELFLDDVKVGVDARLGAEGDGWPIAMMTVAYERGAADVGYLSKFGAVATELEEQLGDRLLDPCVQRDFGRVRMLLQVLNQHVRFRMRQRELIPGVPGPEMSIDKLLMTLVDQTLHEEAIRLLGSAGLGDGPADGWLRRYLYSRAASIYGGSQQVQLNIVAQRLLGLPR